MVSIQYDPYTNQVSEILDNIHFETDKKTVQELIFHYENGRLNLNPAFQRESVWRDVQRRRLIKSLYENIPIPSIFLYERESNGYTIYDVIDGKQRLESIFMFMGLKGFRGKRFCFKTVWEEDGKVLYDYYYWKELTSKEKSKILSYPLQTITIKGTQSDISEIFVRINSTGSRLKPQEIRKASYLTSDFLKECVKVANRKKLKDFLKGNRILSSEQISRQKHVELVSELILSIHHNGLINKKHAIDESMQKNSLTGQQLKRASKIFSQTLSEVMKLFPDLRETRFRGLSDFYTIFMLVWKWKYDYKLALTEKRRKTLAQSYLASFGYNIDRIKLKQKNLERIEDGERLFADYLLTVQSSTDDIRQRRNREKILESVLSDCFKPKDPLRNFNPEQRRIIWYLSNGHCSNKKCNRKLTINNFHVDHIKPHAKGGKSQLKNAQILCAKCNLEKSDKD